MKYLKYKRYFYFLLIIRTMNDTNYINSILILILENNLNVGQTNNLCVISIYVYSKMLAHLKIIVTFIKNTKKLTLSHLGRLVLCI